MGSIILIGPMGAGKTTIGKILSSKLQLEFIDTDALIEHRCGADIPWIFDVEGEDGFRRRETAVLDELLADDEERIIATGGGIILKPENRVTLKKLGTVIYLSASAEQIAERTFKDKKRPLLQVDDPKAKILALLKERQPLYESLADHIAPTDSRGARSVVQHIAKLLKID